MIAIRAKGAIALLLVLHVARTVAAEYANG